MKIPLSVFTMSTTTVTTNTIPTSDATMSAVRISIITKLTSQKPTWARMPPDATTFVIIRAIVCLDGVSVDLYASSNVYCKQRQKYSILVVGNWKEWLGMKVIGLKRAQLTSPVS